MASLCRYPKQNRHSRPEGCGHRCAPARCRVVAAASGGGSDAARDRAARQDGPAAQSPLGRVRRRACRACRRGKVDGSRPCVWKLQFNDAAERGRRLSVFNAGAQRPRPLGRHPQSSQRCCAMATTAPERWPGKRLSVGDRRKGEPPGRSRSSLQDTYVRDGDKSSEHPGDDPCAHHRGSVPSRPYQGMSCGNLIVGFAASDPAGRGFWPADWGRDSDEAHPQRLGVAVPPPLPTPRPPSPGGQRKGRLDRGRLPVARPTCGRGNGWLQIPPREGGVRRRPRPRSQTAGAWLRGGPSLRPPGCRRSRASRQTA